MTDRASTTDLKIRPYRSHKFPACSFCRNRKARCDFDVPGEPCRLCRERKRRCDYGSHDTASARTTVVEESAREGSSNPGVKTPRPMKRARRDYSSSVERRLPVSEQADAEAPSGLYLATGTSSTKSSLMMNPHMADDITVLQRYLSSTTTERPAFLNTYSIVSTGSGCSPVVYLSLPKKRKGLRDVVDPGRTQREIIEQVFGPTASEVRKAYFEHLHPCFPVLDKTTFLDMWHDERNQLSSTLICELYASTLQVWCRSSTLRHQTRPDPHFIWNQAVTALRDDFMAPTISTVYAAVLELLGRPVIGVTSNIVNAGRTVTLAQSLGLHRDPSSWRATAHEKTVRINLWWGVLIHDYWSSIGHGIPPTINPQYYDVPLPTFSNEAGQGHQSESQLQSNTTFVQLCKLSQILGDILTLVYSLHGPRNETQRRLRKIESSLDDWTLELPGYLQPKNTAPGTVNGSSNLRFAYLSLKVLVHRVDFKAFLEGNHQTPEERQYRLAMLRDAALEVTGFVMSLTESQFQEFWMPYTSYLLVTSATILLRCTIESIDLAKKKGCITKLMAFLDCLRTARDQYQWDLADFCIERCDKPIQKIAEALGLSSSQPPTASPVDQATVSTTSASDPSLPIDRATVSTDIASNPEFQVDSFMDDVFLPIDSLDYSWEALWDRMEGPWSTQI